jgi:hypothetical protein
MSGEEDFLKRWSRRKREAAEVARSEPPEAEAGDAESSAAPENGVASDKSADKPRAEFDPASLPPIESITAVSDITAFLRAGVPVELTRAALRRVWTADPAIRDFVGLAENAWDFTDPNAMPGFGPLESTEDVKRMISRIVDSIGKAAQPDAGEASGASAKISKNMNDSSAISTAGGDVEAPPVAAIADQSGEIPAETLGNQVLLHSNKEDAAMQRDDAEAAEKPKQLSRRGHGGALPQ